MAKAPGTDQEIHDDYVDADEILGRPKKIVLPLSP